MCISCRCNAGTTPSSPRTEEPATMSDFILPTPPPTIPSSPKPTLYSHINQSEPHHMLKPFSGNQPDSGTAPPDSKAKYEDFSFATRAIHVGSEPDPVTGAVIPPLSMATTYAQSGVSIYKVSRSNTLTPLHVSLRADNAACIVIVRLRPLHQPHSQCPRISPLLPRIRIRCHRL